MYNIFQIEENAFGLNRIWTYTVETTTCLAGKLISQFWHKSVFSFVCILIKRVELLQAKAHSFLKRARIPISPYEHFRIFNSFFYIVLKEFYGLIWFWKGIFILLKKKYIFFALGIERLELSNGAFKVHCLTNLAILQ